jgi:hypothetical protein
MRSFQFINEEDNYDVFDKKEEYRIVSELTKYPYKIRYIENPTEAMKLAVVKTDPNEIRSIKNPSEEVQLAAVNKNAHCIYLIKDPCEKAQIKAVRYNFLYIDGIKNPTKKVKLIVISKSISRKDYTISNLLHYVKSEQYQHAYSISLKLQECGVNWPELETIKNSAKFELERKEQKLNENNV